MASPLLSGAQGDPLRSQRRIAPQSTNGIPAAEADYVDFRANGGPMAISAAGVDRSVIQAEGVPGRQLIGKYSIGGGPLAIGDVDPNNKGMLHLLANLFTGYDLTDNTTWQKYVFDLLKTGVTSDSYLSLLNDNDVIPRHRFHDMRAGSMQLRAAPNEGLLISFGVGAPEFDFHGAVSQEAGAASSLPMFRRTSARNQDPDATDGELWLKITAWSGGLASVQGKVTTAAAYSDTQTGIDPDGGWIQFRDENGDLVGTQEEHIQYRFPATPTLVVNDEFKVEKRRARWSQTLPTEQPIASAQSLFLQAAVGSTVLQTRVEGGWELNYAYPTFDVRLDVSGRQGGNARRLGNPTAILTLSRDIVDLEFQQGILNGAEVSAVIDARNNAAIGASSRFHRFMVLLPAMKMTGEAYDTNEGGTNIEEPITLTGFAPTSTFNYDADGETYSTDAHCAVCVETDQVIAVATT